MKSEVEVALRVDTVLGEGLHWDSVRGCLWFVDIEGRRLLNWDAHSPSWTEWRLPQRLGWVIPVNESEDLLLGLEQGVARVNLADLSGLDWVARPFTDESSIRLNDAKADNTGAVWFGSLNNDDQSRSDGCLYRLGTNGELTLHDSGYTVANGPALSPDGDWILHTDSGRRTIYAFDLQSKAGGISGKRRWKIFADDEGYPDGMCFDAEGCVWVAQWGAARVSRFAPDGRLLRRIALPASRISNVCFGGAALDRLFVTSARTGMNAHERESDSLAGALFEVDSRGVKGLPGLRCGDIRGRASSAAMIGGKP